ncbi:hypothetical protein QJS66_09185 [Kocuria rhizophila]|nr:hypothetical protein QJS66_09185 [Kocuria rhizophila]
MRDAIIAVCATYGWRTSRWTSPTIRDHRLTWPNHHHGQLAAAGLARPPRGGRGRPGDTSSFAGTPAPPGRSAAQGTTRTGEDPSGGERDLQPHRDARGALVTTTIGPGGRPPARDPHHRGRDAAARRAGAGGDECAPKPYARWMVAGRDRAGRPEPWRWPSGVPGWGRRWPWPGRRGADGHRQAQRIALLSSSTLTANTFVVTLVAIVVSALGAAAVAAHGHRGQSDHAAAHPRIVSTMQDAIDGFPVTAAGRLLPAGHSLLGIVAGIALGVSLTVNVLGCLHRHLPSSFATGKLTNTRSC